MLNLIKQAPKDDFFQKIKVDNVSLPELVTSLSRKPTKPSRGEAVENIIKVLERKIDSLAFKTPKREIHLKSLEETYPIHCYEFKRQMMRVIVEEFFGIIYPMSPQTYYGRKISYDFYFVNFDKSGTIDGLTMEIEGKEYLISESYFKTKPVTVGLEVKNEKINFTTEITLGVIKLVPKR